MGTELHITIRRSCFQTANTRPSGTGQLATQKLVRGCRNEGISHSPMMMPFAPANNSPRQESGDHPGRTGIHWESEIVRKHDQMQSTIMMEHLHHLWGKKRKKKKKNLIPPNLPFLHAFGKVSQPCLKSIFVFSSSQPSLLSSWSKIIGTVPGRNQ